MHRPMQSGGWLRVALVLASIAIAGGAGACATAQARPEVAQPLRIPEPPPKAAIDPVDLPTLESDSVSGQAPQMPVTATPAAPPATRPAAQTAAPAAAPPAAPPVVTPPSAPAAPTAELRPGGSALTRMSARDVKEVMDRTSRKLDVIDRRRLSAGRQENYDAARRFLAQAQEAVKANNLTLAQSAAEKAETLADGIR